MTKKERRIIREKNTIEAMIKIYCCDQHKPTYELPCAECRKLQDYANRRLDRCPFNGDKTTCANCKIHCYRPDMKIRIKDIMRHSGPKMIRRHPVLALLHFIDGLRKQQGRQKS
ncbi:MAG: nitrous oxide-stimulated promoter family protein [Thermodesulfovibrionales bacterium]